MTGGERFRWRTRIFHLKYQAGHCSTIGIDGRPLFTQICHTDISNTLHWNLYITFLNTNPPLSTRIIHTMHPILPHFITQLCHTHTSNFPSLCLCLFLFLFYTFLSYSCFPISYCQNILHVFVPVNSTHYGNQKIQEVENKN